MSDQSGNNSGFRKPLNKVGAIVAYQGPIGKSIWPQLSPWPDTTALCWAEERGGKAVDGVMAGEVRSATG